MKGLKPKSNSYESIDDPINPETLIIEIPDFLHKYIMEQKQEKTSIREKNIEVKWKLLKKIIHTSHINVKKVATVAIITGGVIGALHISKNDSIKEEIVESKIEDLSFMEEEKNYINASEQMMKNYEQMISSSLKKEKDGLKYGVESLIQTAKEASYKVEDLFFIYYNDEYIICEKKKNHYIPITTDDSSKIQLKKANTEQNVKDGYFNPKYYSDFETVVSKVCYTERKITASKAYAALYTYISLRDIEVENQTLYGKTFLYHDKEENIKQYTLKDLYVIYNHGNAILCEENFGRFYPIGFSKHCEKSYKITNHQMAYNNEVLKENVYNLEDYFAFLTKESAIETMDAVTLYNCLDEIVLTHNEIYKDIIKRKLTKN